MVHSVFMNFLIFVFFFFFILINPLVVVVVLGLNSDGQVLISLLNNWNASEEIKSSWNASDSIPCNWIGIQCNSNHSVVVSLNLSHYRIYGQLGPQIGNLRYLNELSLKNTSLSGKIPTELGNCIHLRHLNLSKNNLVGKLPELLFQLPHLKTVDLKDNSLSGSIPINIGNATELTYLKLSYNKLTGLIPYSLGLLTKLSYLSLSSNNLTGKIPIEIFTKCRSLETLFLDENQLEGEIPIELRMLRKLQVFSLRKNNLTGEIPLQITELHGLTYLYLSENRFTGVVPITLGLNSSLVRVYLYKNNFSGEIPPNLCYGKQLKELNLGSNKFIGNIPSNVITTCYSLEILWLSENQLNGSIPPFPANNSLRHITSNRNYFEGRFPRSLVNCKHLQTLDLGNNQINDTFPIWLMSLPDLVFISLRSNKLHGPIVMNSERKIITDNQLKIIDISYNNFSGELPSEFFSQLIVLMNSSLYKYASNDNENVNYYLAPASVIFKGRESMLHDRVTEFGLIDFSNNRFQGKIPESIGQLKLLNSLNLSNNNFNGPIPSSLGKMTKLESLDLSKNKLTGEIPLELTKLSFLSTLNLSDNQLTGRIPTSGQYHSFGEDSFKGNLGLCGAPLLRKSCGRSEDHPNPPTTPKIEQSRSKSIFNKGFGWEPVLIGYSCGLVLVFFTKIIIFGLTYCKKG